MPAKSLETQKRALKLLEKTGDSPKKPPAQDGAFGVPLPGDASRAYIEHMRGNKYPCNSLAGLLGIQGYFNTRH